MRLRCVADDGSREHQPRTSTERLEKTCHNEGMGIGREEPGHARNRENGEANQQRRPAAKAIRRGAVDQLTDSQSQNVKTDRQLKCGGRRVEVLGGGGQRRHEYVHADRPAEGEQAQKPERHGASAIEIHRAADRLRSGVSDRASARLTSRSLTVSSRRSERAKSSPDASPRTRSRMSWDTRST